MSAMQAETRLKEAGIIAMLPGDLPPGSILPVADALVAAPVQAVEVVDGRNATSIIADLRQRAGGHMLVGAGGVSSVARAETAISAGAQFITSPRLDEAIMACCRVRGVLYVPGVISVLAAQAAFQAGCYLIRLQTGGPVGPDYVKTVRMALPELSLVVAADITAANVGHYVRAGAAGVMVGEALFAGPEQAVSEMISNARRLQKAWQLRSPGTWQNGEPSADTNSSKGDVE